MTTVPPAPYSPPPSAAVRRPPLPRSMGRAARLAGGIGFSLMTIGWSLFAAGAVVGLGWALVAAIWGAAAARDPQTAIQFQGAQRWVDTLPVPLIVAAVIAAVVIGALLWVIGLFFSSQLLRRAGHPRPWGVTLAGLGLAIVASWIAYGIAQIVGQLVSVASSFGSASESGSRTLADVGAQIRDIVIAAAAFIVLNFGLDVLAGVLLWWAMAAAMRPAAPVTGPGWTPYVAPGPVA